MKRVVDQIVGAGACERSAALFAAGQVLSYALNAIDNTLCCVYVVVSTTAGAISRFSDLVKTVTQTKQLGVHLCV